MKNESLNKIAQTFDKIDFSNIDGVFAVPVGEICDKLGLSVEFKPLEDGHSGYFDGKTKTIFVNDNYPATRNLFTIAHEIGHYILHNNQDEMQNRFDAIHKYSALEIKQEREANGFAGELLMPEYKIKEVFSEFRGEIKKIADFFGVSRQAIEVRAFNLGLIDNI